MHFLLLHRLPIVPHARVCTHQARFIHTYDSVQNYQPIINKKPPSAAVRSPAYTSSVAQLHTHACQKVARIHTCFSLHRSLIRTCLPESHMSVLSLHRSRLQQKREFRELEYHSSWQVVRMTWRVSLGANADRSDRGTPNCNPVAYIFEVERLAIPKFGVTKHTNTIKPSNLCSSDHRTKAYGGSTRAWGRHCCE